MKRTDRWARVLFVMAVAGWWAASARAQPPDSSPRPPAPAVRLNTIGYLPTAPKVATLAVPAETFAVINVGDGKVAFEGPVSGPKRDAETGETLFVADFSKLTAPGEYKLRVGGLGDSGLAESAPFHIQESVYREPFRTAARSMYLMRCGTAVRGEHEGHTFEHAACHLDDGRLDLIVDESVPTTERQRAVVGGWHDAGDYNKYVVNAGVTVGVLLRAWQDFQPAVGEIELDIPESASPLPDLLAEVKYELEWLLSMQADDGSVHHKVSTANYMGFVRPEDEHDPRFVGEWGSQATASFVAMMAMASRELRPYDAALADRYLAAAKKGYAFLTAHPENRRPSQQGFTTAGYDTSDWSARLWAAAEMWEATGDAAALADFEARAKSPHPARQGWRRGRGDEDEAPQSRPQYEFEANWDWGNVQNLGLITYLEAARPGRDEKLVSLVRNSLLFTADQIVAARDADGYARPLGDRYFWGCNGTVARQAVVLEAARRVDAKPEYRNATLDAVNHLFGRNPYGRSYVTGLGHTPPMFPHDRRSGSDNVQAPWPGNLVGGPHPGPLDWHDHQDDYRTNEIAINWNAALVYALAASLPSPRVDEATGN